MAHQFKSGKKPTTYVRIKVFSLLLGCLSVFALYYVYILIFATNAQVVINPDFSVANSLQFEADTAKALERVQMLVSEIDRETSLMRDARLVVKEDEVVENIGRLMTEATSVEALLARVRFDATRFQIEYPVRLAALCDTLAAKSQALETETVRMAERKKQQLEAKAEAETAAEAETKRVADRTISAHQPAPVGRPLAQAPPPVAKTAKPPPQPAPAPALPAVNTDSNSNLRGEASVAKVTDSPPGSVFDGLWRAEPATRAAAVAVDGEGVGVSAGEAKKAAVSTALLVICANRPEYLERTLAKVLEYHPRVGYSVIISEDGANDKVKAVIDRFRDRINASPAPSGDELKGSRLYSQPKPSAHGGSGVGVGVSVPVVHFHHPHYHEPAENGYFKLSKHFKYALTTVFDATHTSYNPYKVGGLIPSAKEGGFQRVVILEEDIEIAPDFFEFFTAVTPVVDRDKNVLCASAWNDNGFKRLLHPDVSQSAGKLVRSDFFPGLGWMMSRAVWEDLGPKWPRAYWDDWLREPKNRRGRHTIRPEVCRTFHFGTKGTSFGQYNSYLNSIELNKEFVPFTAVDLSYLGEQQWDSQYLTAVREATAVTMNQFGSAAASAGPDVEFKVVYTSFDGREGTSFPRVAAWANCMDNIKANVPRTAYHGVVSVYKDGHRVHLVHKDFN